jgi:hypothetical protein
VQNIKECKLIAARRPYVKKYLIVEPILRFQVPCFRPFLFFNVSAGQERFAFSSIVNTEEVDLAMALLQTLRLRFPADVRSVAVLTPYKAQKQVTLKHRTRWPGLLLPRRSGAELPIHQTMPLLTNVKYVTNQWCSRFIPGHATQLVQSLDLHVCISQFNECEGSGCAENTM